VTRRTGRVARTRWSPGPALLCASVLLAACSNPLDREPAAADIPAGCGGCADEIADLVATLEGTRGVEAVTSTRRTTTGVSEAHFRVRLDLTGEDIVSTDVGAVVDEVAEAAWSSGVHPLDVLDVDVTLRDGYAEGVHVFFGRDRGTYEQRWGQRPEGTEWTPPTEDDEEPPASACERDGCRELMRDLAREVSAVRGVGAVLESTWLAETPTSSTSADVTVRTDGSAPTGMVAEQVAEVVWRSEVAPIDWIDVTAGDADGRFPASLLLWIDPEDGDDRERLEQRWGPRPVG
jgi:hypothetical protein